MNDEEKNVMTILTIARIVESALWYCLNPMNQEGFSFEERDSKHKALVALTAEGTPFAFNCDNNKEQGKALKEDMQYFIEDVYGDNGRIVKATINKKVEVEKSLVNELFSAIVSLRHYLEAFLISAKQALKSQNLLSDKMESLIDTDMRYYHALAGKISCILISDKFIELNKTANTYFQSYSKSHGGINPNTDKNFNVNQDPSYRMEENEFHKLNQDMVTVLNTYGENDEEYRYAREQVYSDCGIFTGEKRPTDTSVFFKIFTSYFDKIIDKTKNVLSNMFIEASKEMNEPSTKEEEVNVKEK